jgi:hypothetical protein
MTTAYPFADQRTSTNCLNLSKLVDALKDVLKQRVINSNHVMPKLKNNSISLTFERGEVTQQFKASIPRLSALSSLRPCNQSKTATFVVQVLSLSSCTRLGNPMNSADMTQSMARPKATTSQIQRFVVNTSISA